MQHHSEGHRLNSSIVYNSFFVDLGARVSNKLAQLINACTITFGYKVYRQVLAIDGIDRLETCAHYMIPVIRPVFVKCWVIIRAVRPHTRKMRMVRCLSHFLLSTYTHQVVFSASTFLFFARLHCCWVRGMRRAMPRDKKKKSIIPPPRPRSHPTNLNGSGILA
jgi:hypothetical protein